MKRAPNIYRSLATLAFLLAAVPMQAGACPKSPGPDLSSVDISSDMTTNGVPVQIRQVSSKANAKDVLDKLEKAWRDEGFAVKRNKAGPWDVLSALSQQCMTTVQLRDEGGTIGLFAIAKPATGRAAATDVGFPLPSGVRILSDVAARTDERPSRTLVLSATDSIDGLTQRFVRSLTDGGWTGIRTSMVQAPGGDPNDVAQRISARQGEDLLSIVVWDKQGAGTIAVANMGQAL